MRDETSRRPTVGLFYASTAKRWARRAREDRRDGDPAPLLVDGRGTSATNSASSPRPIGTCPTSGSWKCSAAIVLVCDAQGDEGLRFDDGHAAKEPLSCSLTMKRDKFNLAAKSLGARVWDDHR